MCKSSDPKGRHLSGRLVMRQEPSTCRRNQLRRIVVRGVGGISGRGYRGMESPFWDEAGLQSGCGLP